MGNLKGLTLNQTQRKNGVNLVEWTKVVFAKLERKERGQNFTKTSFGIRRKFAP